MRWIAILLITVCAVAQDGQRDKQIAQAKKLEARAEKLLDQGKRAEAFEALAKAAEIRERARARKPQSKPKSKPKSKLKRRRADPVEIAHVELDLALKAGNVKAAMAASDRLRRARARQAAQIAALEKQLRALEQQMAEIRKLLKTEPR